MVANSSPPSPDDDGENCQPGNTAMCAYDPADVLLRVDSVLRLRSFRLAGHDRQLREDLYQEGAIAVVKAVARFNPAIGKIDGFAVSCAIHRMRTVCRSHRCRRARCIPVDFRPGGAAENAPPDPVEAGSDTAMVRLADSHRARELVALVLNARERCVIEARYFKNLTTTCTAQQLGVSGARVCQIEDAALVKLRVALGVGQPTLN